VIQKYLGRYGLISDREAQELEEAYAQLKQIQERCFHQFRSGTLFTTDSQVCEYCGFLRDGTEKREAS
jgi:hypothetical protein